MQRIIKSAFPCASTYVHTYVCLCVCVFRELLSTWDLLYKCDTIKQAITIAITTKRFDMYTNKLSSAYRVGGGKSQEQERAWLKESVCVSVWKRERAKERTKAKATSVHCQRAWWRFRFASLRYARVALFHCVWKLCACVCMLCMCVCWSSSLLLLFFLIYSLLCSYWCCSCGCCCCCC